MTTLEFRGDKPNLKRVTQTSVQGRSLVVALFPTFCELLQQGRRAKYQITWEKIYQVAAKIDGDKLIAERKAKRKADGEKRRMR